MKMNKQPELKPCAHCGNKDIEVSYALHDNKAVLHITCYNEECGSNMMYDLFQRPLFESIEYLVIAWNKRAGGRE